MEEVSSLVPCDWKAEQVPRFRMLPFAMFVHVACLALVVSQVVLTNKAVSDAHGVDRDGSSLIFRKPSTREMFTEHSPRYCIQISLKVFKVEFAIHECVTRMK